MYLIILQSHDIHMTNLNTSGYVQQLCECVRVREAGELHLPCNYGIWI